MSATHFGQLLRRLRDDEGATLSEVAEATRISVPMLSRMERGERLPSSDTIKALADHYHVSPRLLAEAASQQHSLNRYADSWGAEPPGEDEAPGEREAPVVSQVPLRAPSWNAGSRLTRSSQAAFIAQPISALFSLDAESPSDAVEDAAVAAEAALRQLAREVRRSASSMSEEDRRRVRNEIRSLGEALDALKDDRWWSEP